MLVTKDLKYLLIEYIVTHPIKLKKYIKIINWSWLLSNPAALYLLEQKIYKCKDNLKDVKNIEILDPEVRFTSYVGLDVCVNWSCIYENPKAKHLYKYMPVEDHIDDSWVYISEDPDKIDLIEKNLDKVYPNFLASNPHPRAINIIEKSVSIKDGYMTVANKLSFCNNPGAIKLLEKYYDLIDWYQLSSNPSAMPLLLANPDKINWNKLFSNSAAIDLIENNLDKLNLVDYEIFANQSIFVLDKIEFKMLKTKYHILF